MPTNSHELTAWLLVGQRDSQSPDSERANLVLKSLNHYWAGDAPLRVVLTHADSLSSTAGAYLDLHMPNLSVELMSDTDLLGSERVKKIASTGWYRHQLVRILGANQVSENAILMLDCDTFATDYFDESVFFEDGKILSAWEPRDNKDWWALSEKLFQTEGRKNPYGMLNTPNIVSGQHMGIVNKVVESQYESVVGYLLGILSTNLLSGDNPFTDYTYYSLWLEKLGFLMQVHHDPRERMILLTKDNIWDQDMLSEITESDFKFQGIFSIVHGALAYSVTDLESVVLKG
jgi:hypothetical protein